MIHRDLKPSNLLLRPADQHIFMIDFGAVKEVGAASGTRIAVKGYSAPEQGLGRPQVQSDLYALGATLVFLLTGRNPQQFYRNLGKGYRLQLDNVVIVPPALRVNHPTIDPPQSWQTLSKCP